MQKIAYLVLILLWSTTPLAINWSVQGVPFSLALAGRFGLAAALGLLVLLLSRKKIPRSSWPAAACAGASTALSMLCVYWASLTVSSGLVAVLFGLIPLATAGFSWLWLGLSLNRGELLAMAMGMTGLFIIFVEKLSLSGVAGVLAVLIAVLIQAAAAVKLKTLAVGQSPLAVNAGALAIAAVLLSIVCTMQTSSLAWNFPSQSMLAIAYLAVFGSVLGFSLYYWLIRECKPITVSLISIITPASALWMGHSLNAEVISGALIGGTACILLGLMVHLLAQPRREASPYHKVHFGK
ncbi:DMT family transporter [Iodobacter fluviatilis]|uniref:EamA family transporter n=1 Tax=Iodobacter fluviatilis TaxID=537 RepID=A0A7G3G8Y6_9NEIS|nr:EamA family transporter [Iodobacter fluviatilis]QBC43619.1 EamA family transporter [Iodobacter fluviatilis]